MRSYLASFSFTVYYDNLTTHRVASGTKVAALSRSAGVSESTIRRIEKHEPSTEETLVALVNALNETSHHKKKPIDPKQEIKPHSKFK